MRQRNWNRAALLSIASFGLVFLLCFSFMSPAGSGVMAAPQTNPKCEVDIAAGKETDCTLTDDKDERMVWYNSSSHDRSVRFKPNDNPFSGHHCWNVPRNTPADRGVPSGKIKAHASKKDYTSYTYDVPCSINPPDDAIRGTPKVTIQ